MPIKDKTQETNDGLVGYLNSKSKTFLIPTIAIVLLALVVMGGYWYLDSKRDKNLITTIGTEKLTNDQYKLFLEDFSRGLDSKDIKGEEKKLVLEKMAELSVLKQEASKLGISVSEADVTDFASKLAEQDGLKSEQIVVSDMVRNAAYLSLLKDRISEKVVGYKTGKVVLARFDKYLEGVVSSDNQSKSTDAEKVYAKSKIDSYNQQVKSGKMTAQEAGLALDNDDRIGIKGWNNTDTYVFSFDLTKDEYINKEKNSASKELWNAINAQAKGVGDVVLCKDKKLIGSDESDVDAFYAFVQIDDTKDGAGSYEAWLEQKFKEYNFDINKFKV